MTYKDLLNLKFSNNCTMIIIAHRLSTIRNCNFIFLIKKGKIAEKGNHESLLSDKNSYYSLLWNIQTGKRTKI